MNPNLKSLARETGDSAIDKNDDVLVFSSDKIVYAYDDDRVVEVVKRVSNVCGFCVHDDKLYDFGSIGSKGLIWQIFQHRPVFQRKRPVRTMYSYGGVLYDGGTYGLFETESDEKIGEFEMVKKLHDHKNQLYVLTDEAVCSVFDEEVVFSESDNPAYNLCSFVNELFIATRKGIVQRGRANTKHRSETVFGFAVCNGLMYDAGFYCKVFETFSDTDYDLPRPATGLCSADGKLYA
jgi:hypothetical protein